MERKCSFCGKVVPVYKSLTYGKKVICYKCLRKVFEKGRKK